MAAVITPFQRLKWGIFPVRRIVDEDENGNFIDIDDEGVATSTDERESLEKTDSKLEATHSIKVSEPEIEYRDEKDRPWWKFFDEYEYRVTTQQKKSRKWYKWFHDDDTPEEKKVITKIDILLTCYSLMAYWVKYLDQTNLTNAYIGGIKEGIAKVTNVPGLKAIRFFIGAFEAPSYIAYHALFASWFRGSTGEVTRRAGFYYIGQYLGVLTSDLLSGAIVRNLNGVNGYEAWQWIFIIDGIISFAVGLIGIYMIPGTPEDCYSIFLTDDEIRIARRRMRKDQKDAKPRENAFYHFFSWETWRKVLTSWHIYILGLWNIFCWNNSSGTSGAYPLWLQSLTKDDGKTPRFNKGQLQDYTALTPALGIIWLILTSTMADLFNTRYGAIIFSQVFNVLGNLLLAIWDIPERAKWFAFCMQYWGWSSAPALYSFLGDICRRDLRQRQIILVACNILAQQSTAWIATLVWKTVEAPRFLKGFSFTASSGFAMAVWSFVVLYFYKRQERAGALDNNIVLYDSSKDEEKKQAE
ncbi:transporter SEO1 [Candida parapsilosis]|nr:transporter SEO1 [Candida parapsilosis]